MEGLKRNIVIMDFSGIYQEEQFYELAAPCPGLTSYHAAAPDGAIVQG